MSGSNYKIQCQRCNAESHVEIYLPDGWDGLKVDNSETVCFICHTEANLQDYFDYKCQECGKWFQNSYAGKDTGTVLDSGTPMCWICVRKLAELVRQG